MIGIIVAGHGNFPTGIMSAVSLIAGNPEHIKAVDFVKGMSSQELKQKLEEQMVMTDLLGGTPFNVASGIKTESGKSIKVLAGTNLAMAVEAIFSRELMGLEELAEIIRQSAKDGVEDFDSLGNDDEMIFEDGV